MDEIASKVVDLLLREDERHVQHIWWAQNADLCNGAGCTPPELNDVVQALERNGLLLVNRVMGTAPYKFLAVSPTAELFARCAQALSYNPIDDEESIVRLVGADPRKQLSGPAIESELGIGAKRINRAVKRLEGRIMVIKTMGNAPFDFQVVRSLPSRGR